MIKTEVGMIKTKNSCKNEIKIIDNIMVSWL